LNGGLKGLGLCLGIASRKGAVIDGQGWLRSSLKSNYHAQHNVSLEVVEVHTPEATHGEVVWHKRKKHRASSKYPGLIDPAIQGQAPKSGKQNMCLLELFKCFSKSAGMSPSPCQVQRCNKKLCDALFMNTVAEKKSTETWHFHHTIYPDKHNMWEFFRPKLERQAARAGECARL